MTTVEDIEKAVARLTPDQLAKIRAWFEQFDARLFDEKIERDAKSGKLDKFAEDAIRAYRKGRTRDLWAAFAKARRGRVRGKSGPNPQFFR